MAKAYIPITESNLKCIKNFIGMCRLNGLEGAAVPTFTFREYREEYDSTVIFDVYFEQSPIEEPSWKMTAKVETSTRFHDGQPSKPGESYSYLDKYRIDKGKLDLEVMTSRFNVFSF